MKKLFYLLLSGLLPVAAYAQIQVTPNATKNYIHQITYKEGYTVPALGSVPSGEKLENISYFDGLGRPVQAVAVRQGGTDAAGNTTDIYTHIEYDAYGREVKKYLPLPAAQNDGRFVTDPMTAITGYYTANYGADLTNIINPYSETRFEASPLNRVLEQGAPGTAWAVNPTADTDHTIKFGYQTNIAGEVLRYDVSLTADYTPTLIANGSYAAATLYKTVTKDENWQPTQTYLNDHTTEEFKDLQGRVVLKRTFNTNVAHDTYYIYDDYGNLTYVLPPKVNTADGVSASELTELCYQYKYDGRNRLIEKKIPGKGWEYIVYNKLDQPVLTQDANLQAQSQWLFTKYDAFGRVVYTGLMGTASNRATLQTAANTVATQFESRTVAAVSMGGATDIRYTNAAYPNTGITELHTLNYYDDYAFDTDGGVSETAYGITPITNVKGLPTGSKVRVLGTSQWTTTVTYYDNKSRPVYVYSHNAYLNTTDKLKTKLDFIGKPLETSTVHTKDGLVTTVIEKFTYDHADRILTQTHQVNSNPVVYIAKNTYDALGQLEKKKVGGNALSELQAVDYKYNIRGWLKAINDVNNIGTIDLFAFKLGYNEGTTPLYNGNISLTQWKTRNTDSSLKTYNYTYDALNRIKTAINTNANYNLDLVNYDKNGNITALKRKGHTNAAATTFGMMDDLTYTYDAGNKLTKVEDIASLEGFKNGANTTTEYTYDQNGNMLSDANKGITNITYNHLNLPTQVFINNPEHVGNISYIYDASGVKLKKITSEGGSLITTEYSGNYIYEGGVLQFFNTAEGYVEPKGTGWEYVFQYKDHLGNIRLSYADADGNGVIAQTEIREENNYYPFGLKHKGYNNVVTSTNPALKYKYNGKEWQDELGLNVTAMDFRQYDNAIGRFNGMDRMAEQAPHMTPYRFAFNNPVYWSDPSGLYEVDKNGNIKITDADEIKNFISYLNNNSGASVQDMSDEIFYSGNYAYELQEVVVTGRSNSAYNKAAQNIFNQIQGAQSKISSFNGDIDYGNGYDAFDFTNRVTGVASTYLTGQSNVLYNIQKNGKIIHRWSKTANGASYWNNTFAKQSRLNNVSKLKPLSTKLGIVSAGLTVYDVIDSQEIRPSHVINSIMTGASFTGVGAVVAGIYFVADFGTWAVTGKGIGDRLDENYGPVYDFKE